MARNVQVKILRTNTTYLGSNLLLQGECALATDTDQLYLGNGSANLLIGGVKAAAALPSFNATTYPTGTLFLVTNGTNTGEDDELWISNGNVWKRVGVNSLADLAGSLDDIADGQNYGKVLLSELDSGAVTRLKDTSTGGGYVTGEQVVDHIADTTNPHQVTLEQARSQNNQISGDIDANNNTITNIKTPVNDSDAVNKAYADALSAGLDPKQASRLATTGNINLSSAPASIDNVNPDNGDRILVWQQTDATENGIYVYNGSGSAMTRAMDFDGTPNNEINGGEYTLVFDGDTYEGYGFVVINPENFSGTGGYCDVGTDDIDWTQFNAAANLSAGAGMIQNGNDFDVQAADNSITVNADSIQVNVDDSTIEVDPSTGGAVQVKDDGITGAKLAPAIAGDGLAQDGSGNLDVGDANKGVQVNADDLEIDASEIAGKALEEDGVDSHKLNVRVDDSTIEVGTGTGENWLQVKDDGITGAKLHPDVAGQGLSQDAQGNLRVGGGNGVNVNADDIEVAFGGVGTGELQEVDAKGGALAAGAENSVARVDHVHILTEIDAGTLP